MAEQRAKWIGGCRRVIARANRKFTLNRRSLKVMNVRRAGPVADKRRINDAMRDLKILPSLDSLLLIPLPNTAPTGPVSPCPRRSRNPTLNNRTETRSSSVNGRDSRRKRGAVSAAPWRSIPSGLSCDRSPDDTFDWDYSSVDSGPRSSDRIDCCSKSMSYRFKNRQQEESILV